MALCSKLAVKVGMVQGMQCRAQSMAGSSTDRYAGPTQLLSDTWDYIGNRYAACCRYPAHAQGEKFLDSLDDIAVDSVVLIDGMAIWGPKKAVGLVQLKMWLADWLQHYDVNAAITASTATPTSNKVGQQAHV